MRVDWAIEISLAAAFQLTNVDVARTDDTTAPLTVASSFEHCKCQTQWNALFLKPYAVKQSAEAHVTNEETTVPS